MVLNWAVRPLAGLRSNREGVGNEARDLPSLDKPLLRWSKRRSFWIAARMGDSTLDSMNLNELRFSLRSTPPDPFRGGRVPFPSPS